MLDIKLRAGKISKDEKILGVIEKL